MKTFNKTVITTLLMAISDAENIALKSVEQVQDNARNTVWVSSIATVHVKVDFAVSMLTFGAEDTEVIEALLDLNSGIQSELFVYQMTESATDLGKNIPNLVTYLESL